MNRLTLAENLMLAGAPEEHYWHCAEFLEAEAPAGPRWLAHKGIACLVVCEASVHCLQYRMEDRKVRRNRPCSCPRSFAPWADRNLAKGAVHTVGLQGMRL